MFIRLRRMIHCKFWIASLILYKLPQSDITSFPAPFTVFPLQLDYRRNNEIHEIAPK